MIGSINAVNPNTYCLLGYVVESNYYKPNVQVNGLPLLGDVEWLVKRKDTVSCVLAIGYPKERMRVFNMLRNLGIDMETIISPEIYVDQTCKIGEGCYIGYRTVLSVNSVIGDGVFINTDGILGHNLTIGDFVTIWPRVTISGYCTIESLAEIGGGTYIIPRRKIGEGAVIAAGSVVFSNVKAGTRVIGNPAKRLDF